MRAKEFLFELADKPYPFQIAQQTAARGTFGFNTDNGSEYIVHITPYAEGGAFQNNALDVSFALMQNGKHVGTATGTAGEDALRVFSTVLEAVKQALTKRAEQGVEINYIQFKADTTEPKRVALYQRFAKNINRYLPGWEFAGSNVNDGIATFLVKRKSEELDEVEELDFISKSKSAGFRGPKNIYVIKDRYGAKKLLDTGRYSIWKSHEMGTSIYYVVDNKTDLAQIQLTATERNNVLSGLGLYAAPGNTIKAADFYRLLITKLNKVLVADKQSPGSQAVWAKLNKFPDVGVHGWLNGKAVNIDTKDREYAYGTSPKKSGRWVMNPSTGMQRWVSNDTPENRDAVKMKLVAHKK